jgi:hypothetical protein
MVVYKNILKATLVLSFLLIVFLVFSFLYNKYQVKPTEKEIVELNKFYKSLIDVNDQKDILVLQNHTINNIMHEPNGINEINIIKTLQSKKGLCFNRSMVMQKALIYNNINVRPVFLYSNPFNASTDILDFFSTKIYTHNIFEYCWKGKWYVMETNNKMFKPLTLNAFLIKQKIFKIQPRYLRYLNNRNGRFISPSWIPDIY